MSLYENISLYFLEKIYHLNSMGNFRLDILFLGITYHWIYTIVVQCYQQHYVTYPSLINLFLLQLRSFIYFIRICKYYHISFLRTCSKWKQNLKIFSRNNDNSYCFFSLLRNRCMEDRVQGVCTSRVWTIFYFPINCYFTFCFNFDIRLPLSDNCKLQCVMFCEIISFYCDKWGEQKVHLQDRILSTTYNFFARNWTNSNFFY